MIRSIFTRLPGLVSVAILILPFWLTIAYPEAATVFFSIFALFWLYRATLYSVHLIRSFRIFKRQERINWQEVLAGKNVHVPHMDLVIDQRSKLSQDNSNSALHARDVEHLIIIATYKEPYSVLAETVESILQSTYNLKQVRIIIAVEERDQEQGTAHALRLKETYGDHFLDFAMTIHPKNIPGEVVGKAGNITFAAQEYVRTHLTSYTAAQREQIIVTTLDADNKPHKDYLSVLSYTYAHTPNRQHFSYQPLPLLCNNFWEVPIFVRLIAVSATFWHFIESGRPDRLRNFSSHAQPLTALLDMDFWNTASIVEDGHQFWRSYMHFRGSYKVVPLFIPIYQDAVQHDTYTSTLIAQYKQLRRWAHGAEDIGYMAEKMWQYRKELPFFKTLGLWIYLFEGHIMWSTAPVLLTLTTKMFEILNPAFLSTTMYYNYGYIMSLYFTVALSGIVVSIWISFLLLPKPSAQNSILKKTYYMTSMVFMWALLPITTIFFSAVPSLEAQIRLLLGKHMEFQVTKKVRQEKTLPPAHEKVV